MVFLKLFKRILALTQGIFFFVIYFLELTYPFIESGVEMFRVKNNVLSR